VSGLLLEEAAPSPGAHVFVVGGEVFPVSLARDLQLRYPRSQIYNHYGPTEAVVGCAWYDVTAQLSALEEMIPVGRPMSNTVLYVVDGAGRLQPQGVWGELWIGGAGVARGYLNRAELTAEKFVSDPFGGEGRVYRSGDRARWRSDGQLELQGRLDDQVKVRGYRIELGDVESALRGVAGVREAAVAVHGEGVSSQLVGYVVGDASLEEVRRGVAQVLPEYMHPALYVVLERLPQTLNGKLDRRSLPAPERREEVYEAPRPGTEVRLAEIWAQVLRQPGLDIGAQDDFFTLGGHSILAIRLLVKISEVFQLKMNARDLFRYPTLRGLARHIDDMALTPGKEWSPLVAFEDAMALPQIFCVPATGLTSVSYRALAVALRGRLGLNILEPQGLDGTAPPHTAIEEIVEMNLQALRDRQPEGPYLLAGHSFGGAVAFEMALKLQAQGERAKLLLIDSMLYLDERQRHSRSAEGYLYQDVLEDTGEERPQALVAMRNVFDAQIRIHDDYLPSGTFRGEVALLLAEAGVGVIPRAELIEHYRPCFTREPDVAIVAGAHLSMLLQDSIESLATAIVRTSLAADMEVA
jgi:thioesterase domain-containing protein/acyl carrier protein